MNLDSNFLRPPLRLRKMVSCFWKPLSVLGEREEKGGKKKKEKDKSRIDANTKIKLKRNQTRR